MIAYVCGLKPGDFIHVLGDAHVYSNHVDPLQQQLQRNPREFPRLLIRKGQASNGFGLYDFGINDFELIGYEPHSLIAMDVAV
jgi:thymidylate synthase